MSDEFILGVGLLGFDERAKNVLKLFFDGPCSHTCALVDHVQADITLIDLDAYGGRDLKAKHDSLYPGRPVLLTSIRQVDPGDDLFLPKPLNAAALKDALAKVRERLMQEQLSAQQLAEARSRQEAAARERRQAVEARTPEPKPRPAPATATAAQSPTHQPPASGAAPAQGPAAATRGDSDDKQSTAATASHIEDGSLTLYVGSSPDINIHDADQVAKARYSVDLYLQGYLRKACAEAEKTGQPIKVSGIWRTIVVDPASRTITSELSEAQLRSLCILPTKEHEVHIEPCQRDTGFGANAPSGRRHEEALDAFLWRVALWTSRGRVPEETDLNEQVFLKHWPNLTRLVLPPHALRIAALWVKRPYGLARTAELLGVPQRFVFAFCTAAWSLGLADQGRRQADQVMESPPPEKAAHPGLLHRILNRLRGRAD